jgi:hypothetical protein
MTFVSMIGDVISGLTPVWTFITGNPLLLAMVASPVVIGFIAAFIAIFRR